jgi:hypothetical protein
VIAPEPAAGGLPSKVAGRGRAGAAYRFKRVVATIPAGPGTRRSGRGTQEVGECSNH